LRQQDLYAGSRYQTRPCLYAKYTVWSYDLSIGQVIGTNRFCMRNMLHMYLRPILWMKGDIAPKAPRAARKSSMNYRAPTTIFSVPAAQVLPSLDCYTGAPSRAWAPNSMVLRYWPAVTLFRLPSMRYIPKCRW